MPKFRERPIIVDAEQFNPDILPWPLGIWYGIGKIVTSGIIEKLEYNYWINTLEGEMIVKSGDWIITGIQGECYPCKPDIFDATYELVEE